MGLLQGGEYDEKSLFCQLSCPDLGDRAYSPIPTLTFAGLITWSPIVYPVSITSRIWFLGPLSWTIASWRLGSNCWFSAVISFTPDCSRACLSWENV